MTSSAIEWWVTSESGRTDCPNEKTAFRVARRRAKTERGVCVSSYNRGSRVSSIISIPSKRPPKRKPTFNERFLSAVRFAIERHGVATVSGVMLQLWPDADDYNASSFGQRLRLIHRGMRLNHMKMLSLWNPETMVPGSPGIPVIVKDTLDPKPTKKGKR